MVSTRTGETSWHPDEAWPAVTLEANRSRLPPWASNLRTAAPPTGSLANAASLRAAAVLVVVSSTNGTPEVMLTRRSSELSNYPDRLVFPGGSLERADDGPVAAALREATEEIGLDPDGLTVLGMLPDFALTDTGFVVTPVVAHCETPRFVHPPNTAEVTELVSVSLVEPIPTSLIARMAPMTAAVVDILRARVAATSSSATSG